MLGIRNSYFGYDYAKQNLADRNPLDPDVNETMWHKYSVSRLQEGKTKNLLPDESRNVQDLPRYELWIQWFTEALSDGTIEIGLVGLKAKGPEMVSGDDDRPCPSGPDP